MGYSIRPGTQIRDFHPDDTDTEMYISSDFFLDLKELQEKINEKWPGASAENIDITSEYIHTHCLGYDCYDPGDYTNFIVIRRKPGA